MLNKIDSHQHFWRPERGDYGWMPKDNATLNRNYLPDDLAPILKNNGVEGTVLVQAAPTIEETSFMLELADDHDFIKGVVGWIDFEDRSQASVLERFALHPKFLGVRPMIQDIADLDWMHREDIQWAYSALVELNLRFDALGYPQHLHGFLRLAHRHPDLKTVYDHCMKPRIRGAMDGQDEFSDWSEGITLLANETKGSIKFSGLVTEARSHWTLEDLRPFADHVLNTFGPDRMMWGSDWPVCRLRAEYNTWLGTAKALTNGLTDQERSKIFRKTAVEFYGLDN